MRNLSFRTARWLGNLFAFRHWRGRAIHSPFMYGLVRGVWVERRMTLEEYLGYPCIEAGDRSPAEIETLASELAATPEPACLVVRKIDCFLDYCKICQKISAEEDCVSVDRYKEWYLFFHPKLPRQHYKIRY